MSHFEYIAFNLIVVVPPLLIGLRRSTFFLPHWPAALVAIVTVGLPFIVWDAAVTGRHWWFNEAYITGLALGPLPIEELLFFFTMPFACLFTWFSVFSRLPARSTPSWPLLLCLPLGAAMFFTHQPEYTSAAVLALGLAAALGQRELKDARTYAFLALVAALNIVFNGYLTARPVVLYAAEHRLGPRLFTIPVEDFIYGSALVLANLAVFHRVSAWLRGLIPRRLGGYRQTVHSPDPTLPERLAEPKRVAVIGSGIAGLTAATLLAERGFSVVLKERNPYLGGKVGAWREDGIAVEHGFHAFFRQYYNLNRLLERVGVRQHFSAIDDYTILAKDGASLGFKDVATTPVLNLLSLVHQGILPWRDLVTNPKLQKLEALLMFDAETHARSDTTSFAELAEQTHLPPRLRLAFGTFARAFFADERRMSLAELIKGFHFYYLSNDAGLLYDHLNDDAAPTLLAPFERYLRERGVSIELGREVKQLSGRSVDGEQFDAVVLATTAAGAAALCPEVAHLKSSQRYAVLRVYLDKDVPRRFPVFVVTERDDVLDAVTFNHWFQREAMQWAKESGGGVYEAHCYALPDDVPEAEVTERFVAEMQRRIPELRGAKVLRSHLQVRNDFTAYHTGCYATRPLTQSQTERVVFAGDWVRLPYPAMLMEAACMSGVLAVNALCASFGVRGETVEAVPQRGLLKWRAKRESA